MNNIKVFLSENFQFLEVKFSIYLNRRVFVMKIEDGARRRIVIKPSLQVWFFCVFISHYQNMPIRIH